MMKARPRLGVMINAEVFYSEINHFADNAPGFNSTALRTPAAPKYLEQDFSTSTPNEYLSKAARWVLSNTVEAIIPDSQIRTSLKLESEPCLLWIEEHGAKNGSSALHCSTILALSTN